MPDPTLTAQATSEEMQRRANAYKQHYEAAQQAMTANMALTANTANSGLNAPPWSVLGGGGGGGNWPQQIVNTTKAPRERAYESYHIHLEGTSNGYIVTIDSVKRICGPDEDLGAAITAALAEVKLLED